MSAGYPALEQEIAAWEGVEPMLKPAESREEHEARKKRPKKGGRT